MSLFDRPLLWFLDRFFPRPPKQPVEPPPVTVIEQSHGVGPYSGPRSP